MARELRPGFLLVSAASTPTEVDDYRRLMEVVAEVAPAGRIVSALEGGTTSTRWAPPSSPTSGAEAPVADRDRPSGDPSQPGHADYGP